MMEDVTTASSRAPFARAPHMSFGSAAVWFTSPPGLICQFVRPGRGTIEITNWIVGPVYDELERRFPGRNGLIMVFDLELMTGRSAAARSGFLAKARECGRRFSQGYFVQPLSMNSAQRVATVASLALIRALGVRIEIASSARAVVASRNLLPAL